jgi:hypothetical protein
MTALRLAIRILRYVNETLVLVLQALFPPPDARQPLPAADVPAERHAHLAPVLEYGSPGSGGPGAGPDGAQSRRQQAGGATEGVSRIDSAKMLLLAVVAVSAIALARRVGPLPAWTVYPKRRAGGRADRIGGPATCC